MKLNIIYYLCFFVVLVACGSDTQTGHKEDDHDHNHEQGQIHGNEHQPEGEHEHEGEDHETGISFSEAQYKALGFKIDTLPLRNLGSYVEANGELEVPPQNQAEITPVIGSNVKSISVIEGEKVKKGQVLAYLSHPDLILLQTSYIKEWNELQYLEQEYNRQEKLYQDQVASGKSFQKLKADYKAQVGMVAGLEAQLKLLGIGIDNLKENKIAQSVAVRSPIKGYVRLVEVKVGQYVNPSTSMFEIINNDHVHADLMVFESDVHKVHEGQKVLFSVQSIPEKQLLATIYSVGQNFENDPKAIHIHAEIDNKEGHLIPGMYVRGRIIVDDYMSYALPEQAVVREEAQYFIFSASQKMDHGELKWTFEPIEVGMGINDSGWVEIKLMKPLKPSTQFAWNNAYNLMAELKKGEAEHSH